MINKKWPLLRVGLAQVNCFRPRVVNDERGSVAILFAVSLTLFMLVAGLALDFSFLQRERVRAQEAADSAVLAGVRQAQNLIDAGTAIGLARAQGEAVAARVFAAEFGTTGTFQPKITVRNGELTGEGNFTSEIKPLLLQIGGIKALKIDIETEVKITAARHVEIHVVVDNSQSLGVGASEADINIMAAATNCAFACHVPDDADATLWSTHGFVRNSGAVLRIDVIRDAIRQFAEDINRINSANTISLALYSFSNTLTILQSATPSLPSFQAELDNLDLAGNWLQGGTSFDKSLEMLSDEIGVSGDGSSAAQSEKFIILITDGVATNIRYDRSDPTSGQIPDTLPDPNFVTFPPTFNGIGAWSLQGFDPAACAPLKSYNKAKIYTLNIEYRIPKVGTDDDPRFDTIEANLKGDIGQNLDACATDSSMHFLIEEDVRIIDSLEAVTKSLQERMLAITR